MDPDTLTYDEWDALLIEEWFQADPGAPLPVSSREGEFVWAHQNRAAWVLVDEPELNGLSKVDAQKLMAARASGSGERKFNPSQPRGPHTGKWIKGAGVQRLQNFYGDRLNVATEAPHAARHLIDLERFPPAVHERMAQFFKDHPNGGVFIGDGSMTGLTPQQAMLKGVTPRGWEGSGKTWDDVPGGYDASNRQVLLGNDDSGEHGHPGHDAKSLAGHEFAHAVDRAHGHISATQRWYDTVGHALSATGHPYFKYETNPTGLWEEAFAEAFSEWSRAVNVGEDPVLAIERALRVHVALRDAPEVRQSLSATADLFEELSK